MDVPFWVWALTIGLIVGMLIFDLVGHVRTPHAPTLRESAIWSGVYVGIAVVFGLLIFWFYGAQFGGEYFAGYITEKSLSVDNLFVFVLIMAAFGVPRDLQQKVLLFGIEPEVRLSVAPPIAPLRLLAIPAGGLVLGLAGWLWARRRKAPPVDPVEANALRGGRMSIQDSVFVAGQTILSNGFGGSVGLEAAYTQIGGAVASRLGVWLNLRRADLRLLVGAGAGAASRWPAIAPRRPPAFSAILDVSCSRYDAAVSPETRPKTTQPRRDEPPRRFAPCTPPATSPAAKRPEMGLPSLPMTRDSASISRPPMV